jgi:hypothetical protein
MSTDFTRQKEALHVRLSQAKRHYESQKDTITKTCELFDVNYIKTFIKFLKEGERFFYFGKNDFNEFKNR